MASILNPYLSFEGTAKDAMEFYQAVLGGELDLNTFGEFGATEAGDVDKIMHARLETPDGFVLMGADTPAGMPHQTGSGISLSLSGDDEDNLRGWFSKLADEGQVTMPLEKQVWGDEFGMLVDKFGVAWMINIGS